VARPLAALLSFCAAVLAVLGFAAPASAADGPTAITIEGAGLGGPLSIHSGDQNDLFNRLLHQVTWMAAGTGDPMRPDPATLGPKYLVTVYADDKPVQRYDVYPLASGGPKAFRPANQPKGRVGEAWFYVSQSVPELMHAAGVPVADPASSTGADSPQYGDPAGYIPAASSNDNKPLFSFGDILHAQRRTLALWLGSALVILLLVVGAARLSRRFSGQS
jgi:hypothetical protein